MTLLSLLLAEGLVRGLHLAPRDRLPVTGPDLAAAAPQPLCVLTESPELYTLNPRHPDVGPQGLRNAPVVVPKPPGTFRILVLGDSIAYGMSVAREAAFPQQMQRLLRTREERFEVVNAGVPGYSIYNELHWYLRHGRRLEPDLVVVAFCLNDIVNPRLHWGAVAGLLVVIPDAAIPDLDFDREVVRAALANALQIDPEALSRRQPRALDASALYRYLRQQVKRWFGSSVNRISEEVVRQRRYGISARTDVPTAVTAEDSLSIEVLLDAGSPERRWLDGMYRELQAAVAADGIRLVVAMVPLAFQLDEGYPFVPQRDLQVAFEAAGLFCLDLLPVMARHAKADMFLLDRQKHYYDLWHPTEAGHAVVAAALVEFLDQHQLLDRGR